MSVVHHVALLLPLPPLLLAAALHGSALGQTPDTLPPDSARDAYLDETARRLVHSAGVGRALFAELVGGRHRLVVLASHRLVSLPIASHLDQDALVERTRYGNDASGRFILAARAEYREGASAIAVARSRTR